MPYQVLVAPLDLREHFIKNVRELTQIVVGKLDGPGRVVLFFQNSACGVRQVRDGIEDHALHAGGKRKRQEPCAEQTRRQHFGEPVKARPECLQIRFQIDGSELRSIERYGFEQDEALRLEPCAVGFDCRHRRWRRGSAAVSRERAAGAPENRR